MILTFFDELSWQNQVAQRTLKTTLNLTEVFLKKNKILSFLCLALGVSNIQWSHWQS